MFEVLEARNLAPDIRYLRVQAPKIALRRKPGQFVIVRATSDGERIPLTIADADPGEGWIALICQGMWRDLWGCPPGSNTTETWSPSGAV